MIKFLTLNLLKYFDFLNQSKVIKFLKKKGYKKFDTLFDVGAHRGETIKLFLNNFSIKKIYSFEPLKVNFFFLKKNSNKLKKTNNEVSIIVENIALGNENKKVLIKQFSETSSSTINDINLKSKYFRRKSFLLYDKKKPYSEKEIDQIKFSDYIKRNDITKIDFLKIDTEGFEMKVLNGLGDQLTKVGIIMFEHHYDNMIIKRYKFSDINKLLIENNFRQIFKYKMAFRKTFEYVYVKKS
tara:strand:+ start:11658 stop:12377 length:720 start_codon:yes stop_codon:yes gene_type:complete